MSKNEVGHIIKSFLKKAITTPKLFIKYQKQLTIKGDLPTILVIPATNFSDTFAKLGYLGSKNIFEKNGMNYTIYTIVQASQVQEKWEELNCK